MRIGKYNANVFKWLLAACSGLIFICLSEVCLAGPPPTWSSSYYNFNTDPTINATTSATTNTQAFNCARHLQYSVVNQNSGLGPSNAIGYVLYYSFMPTAQSTLPLCPGNYMVHLVFLLWANQGGGGGGCGAYLCGVSWSGISDTTGRVLIPGFDISDRDYDYEPKTINITGATNNGGYMFVSDGCDGNGYCNGTRLRGRELQVSGFSNNTQLYVKPFTVSSGDAIYDHCEYGSCYLAIDWDPGNN